MKSNDRPLQILMGFVAVFHIGVGLGLNLMPGFVETMAGMYGAEVAEWSPQFTYILYPLGTFMLALGAVAALTATQPEKFRAAVYVFAGLFIIRALHRLLLGDTITEVFTISSGRNYGNATFFFGLAAALIVAEQLAHRARSGKTEASA